MDTPFNIGDTYYLPRVNPEQIKVPCPVCYGHKRVTMILGNGEQVCILCEMCQKGFEEPRGYVSEYTYEPAVVAFTIQSVDSMHGGKWYLRSTIGDYSDFDSLKPSEESAMAWSKLEMANIIESNMKQSESRTKRMREQACWSIGYHEKCIADLERKMAWHRSKVSERKKAKRPQHDVLEKDTLS